MKRKILFSLLICALLVTGCGNKKESKDEENKSSNSKVVSSITCTRKSDSIENTTILNFDKDDMLVDGKTIHIYAKESDAKTEYNVLVGTVTGHGASGYDDVQIDGNKLVMTFTAESPVIKQLWYYVSSNSKENLKKYWEKNNFVCE